MTDGEMLRWAAKAAGAKMTDYSDRTPDHWIIEKTPRYWVAWNPLDDDGDALRLAVKLNLWDAIRLAHRLLGEEPDMYAATRRAIVRAAAEIGRSK